MTGKPLPVSVLTVDITTSEVRVEEVEGTRRNEEDGQLEQRTCSRVIC